MRTHLNERLQWSCFLPSDRPPTQHNKTTTGPIHISSDLIKKERKKERKERKTSSYLNNNLFSCFCINCRRRHCASIEEEEEEAHLICRFNVLCAVCVCVLASEVVGGKLFLSFFYIRVKLVL